MGVEYAHGLFVRDLGWRPAWAHVEAIHAVLVRWELVAAPPELYIVDAGEPRPIDDARARAQLPANLAAIYDGTEGAPVARVMGPSSYEDVADEDRYLQHVQLVLGVDFRTFSSETFDVEILALPLEAGAPVSACEDRSVVTYQECFPATWATVPPRTRSPNAFPGIWRSGLILDCGKDVPAIAEGAESAAPGFVAELAAAFGTDLVQQGCIY